MAEVKSWKDLADYVGYLADPLSYRFSNGLLSVKPKDRPIRSPELRRFLGTHPTAEQQEFIETHHPEIPPGLLEHELDKQ